MSLVNWTGRKLRKTELIRNIKFYVAEAASPTNVMKAGSSLTTSRTPNGTLARGPVMEPSGSTTQTTNFQTAFVSLKV